MDHFEQLVLALPDHGVAVLDPSGVIRAWNPAAGELTGHAEAEALGSQLSWLHAPAEVSEWPEDALAAAAIEPIDRSFWRERRDGSRFWCEAKLFALRGADGAVTGFAECFRDASEEHARAVVLGETEARFGAAMRGASILVFNQDRDLRYTWLPIVATELGITAPEQVLGHRDEDFFSPETAATLTTAKRGVLETGVGTRIDVEVETDEGTRFYDLTVEPQRDPDGSVVGITCASVDVTAQRRAQREIQRTGERLAEAERVARMGSWEWDIASNEVHWSDGLYRIHGLEPEQFSGQYEPSSDRVHPDDHDRVDAAVREAVETGGAIDLEYRIVRPDGRIRRLHGRAEAIVDASGRTIRLAGTAQDVTDLRAAEDALERTAAELMQRALDLHRVARNGGEPQDPVSRLLSPRQLGILALVADGHSNGEIAARLFVTESTVKWHMGQILRRLGVANRAQAVARYLASDARPEE